MSTAGMAAVAHLPALRVFRLQCGPPCVPVDLEPLARCTTLTSLSVAFDMRHRGVDLGQVPCLRAATSCETVPICSRKLACR